MSELNVKQYFRVAFLALLLPFASGDCIDLDLGMESRLIPDSNITASSEKNANTAAENGRLNSGSSWCAETSDSNPYLQIDLQTLHIICAVSTQGNSQADQWVKTYKLNLSTDGSIWTDYNEGGQVKYFIGNEDRNSEVKHILYEGVFARYFRFLPETHQGAVCLRTELFGVKLRPENLALGKLTAQSSTFRDASIGNAVSGRAVDGNPDTNMNNKHCSQTNISNPSWWRVDLGSDYVPVSQIYIVNPISPGDPTDTSKDYEITLGRSADVTANTKCKGRYTFIKFKASALCFTDPLTTGRYVGIKTTKSQALQLCEVEIYSRDNLAYNKQTSQISTDYGGVSSRGVDGKSAIAFERGSCTHTKNDEDKAWWRVDLGNEEHVTEVYIVNRDRGNKLANFEIRVGTISDNGGVTNPACGSGYSVPIKKGVSFFCHPSLHGRYVTIRSLIKKNGLLVCEVEVYSERRACPLQAVGVASRDAFPNSSFSASSSSSGNEAFNGRLYGGGAWSPSDNNNASDYLQIDLLYEFVICAVATQGRSTADHWTTKYKLQLSYDGSSWVIYHENNTDKVFNGNSGRNDIVKHSLKEYASARFIRFQPTTYSGHKALRVEVFGVLVSRVPSQAPSGLTVIASTSTSVTASWQSPPENARHGIITGFKLFHRKKDSAGLLTELTNNVTTLTRVISMLDKYTEYEFQVLAFTSKGDGPKSPLVVERTKEDAPDVPATVNHTIIAPDKSHGPRVNLIWSEPIKANGKIRSYTLFYGHEKYTRKETFGKDILSYSVDVLGGLTYEFSVRAVTIKPGENVTLTVNIPEYEPSVGPDNVIFSELNKTTFNISWAPLTRERSYGKVIMYDVKEELVSTEKRRKRSISSRTLNTTTTFVVLYDLPHCSLYHVSVRAYTKAGPGPYSQLLVLQTSRPEPPQDLKKKHFGTTEVTLEWAEPNFTIEGASYTVKYSGAKSYNESFKDDGLKEEIKSTTYSVKNLVPGSQYDFEVYVISVCGKSSSAYVEVETGMEAPIAPVVDNFADVTVTESVAGIYLWPVEQRNGPISAYQVIVLKVVDGAKELPDDYDAKLKDVNNANEENLNFYIAAEISNAPVYKESWKFTVGDDTMPGGFVNKALERGEEYVIYQRALTHDNDRILKGEVGKVAIIVVAQDVGGKEKTEDSGSFNAVAVAVPVVLLLLILTAIIIVMVWYRRKKQSQSKNERNRTPCQLDDIPRGSVDTTISSISPVYQNVADIGQHHQDVVEEPPPEEKEVVYSEAEDGKPKPIPVAEFVRYFRTKSSNGAIVLREEFKTELNSTQSYYHYLAGKRDHNFQNLPAGLQFPWEVGKSNRRKNRYGNIASYDHSRVVLEKIEGDPNSDYINASYMPTFDEETMCYIATQGPTQETLNDFWRMIWQENCCTIVMLTNLVEMGKKKCDQYWPDSTTQYGSIRVTLQKTENFADYVVRTFVLVKGSEKRVILQFHYVTWPDKGVPERSTALLGFRWKVHARHQATGGPLVVHCSAGVGRTGTYIGIDAMLEGAEEKKSVFIQNYVQVMRRCRPYMVQKEEQYVFLHQAVMEALTCGNTEIAPQDLRIAMRKLATVHKSSQRTGFAQEFKRLALVSTCQSSEKESEEGFKPSSINKNRFPNIVPLDSSRVILSSSEAEKNYINASFADGYKQRGTYILTQAPLDNTVEDFWCMISQYEIGTIVMLNSLKEGKESYPQYWPAEGSTQYGSITLQILSENASKNITTRKFSVSKEKPRKQKSVQHLHFTGWSNPDSCPDPKEILDLFAAIQQSQQQTGNGIIVFQCSDGVGRSGCVSSIMSVIDRVKNEQTVDVFQTVKLIRARRPGAVDTLDRYELCYKTIQAYLDSFSNYANFAEC